MAPGGISGNALETGNSFTPSDVGSWLFGEDQSDFLAADALTPCIASSLSALMSAMYHK